MTTLIIARHGNTFRSTETPTRVGARTDLPLTEEGEEQALRLGHHLKSQNMAPSRIYTSQLRRTIDTARLACVAMACTSEATPLAFLNEIDYGPDENKTDADVRERVGEAALKNWDENMVMPDGWSPRPTEILLSWKSFLDSQSPSAVDETALLVTSNGIARFALCLTDNGRAFKPKLGTGCYGIITQNKNGLWTVTGWNLRP